MRVSRTLLHRVDPKDERGATLLIVAISMVAIFGMVVLTVDLGGLLVKRRGMVNSNDAAALAAAETFALNKAQRGSNEGPAQQAADSLATQNQSNAIRDSWNTGPFPNPAGGSVCANSTNPVCGSVSLAYHGNQSLFFAPILGFGRQVGVKAAATAIWGPAGAAKVVPIELDSAQLIACGFDPNNPQNFPPGTKCGFWYNNNDQGSSTWGWMNLNQWNVPIPGTNCSNAGSAQRNQWLMGNFPSFLGLNYPNPTYVCVDSGATNANYQTLGSPPVLGSIKEFPLQDPTKGVDKNGNNCIPPACSPYAYDIVGFTALQITQLLAGTDPAAIGGSGTCQGSATFNGVGSSVNIDLLSPQNGSFSCPGNYPDNSFTPGNPFVFTKKGNKVTVYTQCNGGPGPCDYTFTRGNSSDVITWNSSQKFPFTVTVNYSWSTKGLCGFHPPDANAHCLVTTYEGFQTGGINPGGGGNFGLEAIRLSA